MFDEYKGIDIRRCDKCGRVMLEGFCFPQVLEHYCSDECLYSEVTKDEYLEYYENDDAYYTDWYHDYRDHELEDIYELMEKEEHDGLQETE